MFGTTTGFDWHPFGLTSFGADMTGFVDAQSAGTYTFTLTSDDGSDLLIDGNVVILNGGIHGLISLSGSVALTAGSHSFEVQFDEDGLDGSGVDLTLPEGISYVTGPSVTSSVAQSLLWPPHNQLVNVGLNVDVNPPDATLQFLVYGNDRSDSSDVRDIAPDTLRLRAERQLLGTGRVYLIIAQASDSSGNTALDVSTVVVPRFNTPVDIFAVQAQAIVAAAQYRDTQTLPPGFHLLGEGSTGADGNHSPNATVSVVGLGQLASSPQGLPAVPGSAVTVATLATVPVSPEVQPDQPTLTGTVPAFLPVWDNQHSRDAVFAGWDTTTGGLALTWE
jgi:hypothetical protein